MITELPQDQAALIVERLGRAKVEELTVDCPDAGTLYTRCVRAMGHEEGGQSYTKVPTKGQAWVEVMHHKLEDDMPDFSHRYITKAIMQFGGWQHALTVFTQSGLEKAKYKFYFAYEDVLEGA